MNEMSDVTRANLDREVRSRMAEDGLLFVGEDLRFIIGSEASTRLQKTNDLIYVDDRQGIVRVPKDRWNIAQKYEHKTWMTVALEAIDDRNAFHELNFDNYSSLRGLSFGSAIELGCGPFTNLRLIARKSTISRCTLLDPLVEKYLNHKNCTFSHGVLKVGDSWLNAVLEKTKGGKAVRRVVRKVSPRLLIRGIPIDRLISAPIEEITDIGQYDIVVMINVIEHCFDIERIFASIIKVCKKGGLFVFHDRLYDAQRVKRRATQHFDAGHPLRVDESIILGFLEANFSKIYERRTVISDGYKGIDLSEWGLYFIGSRK